MSIGMSRRLSRYDHLIWRPHALMTMPDTGQPASPERDRRWISLYVLCAGFLLIVVDMTIVNVALPSIQRDLRFSQAGLAWVVNAYLIAFAGLLLLSGRLGDLLGRKRVFLAGLALFTLASVACGLSFSQPVLIAARFVQGVGGAASSAVILGMVVTMFPDPGDRARAIGVFSFIASGGAAVGLIAGGLITQAVSWHWIFFVNVPIGAVVAVLAYRLLDDQKGIGLGDGADVVGAILVTAALMLGVYAIVGSSNYGLRSLQTIGFGGLAVALLLAFIVYESRVRNPILPLRLFRSRSLSGANVVQILLTAGFFSFFFIGALDLENTIPCRPLHGRRRSRPLYRPAWHEARGQGRADRRGAPANAEDCRQSGRLAGVTASPADATCAPAPRSTRACVRSMTRRSLSPAPPDATIFNPRTGSVGLREPLTSPRW